MGRFTKPNVPHVEAATTGGRQRPSLIVLQSSFTTADAGAAYAIAMRMHNPQVDYSWHYVVDAAQIIRCVDDRTIAHHRPQPKHAIGIQICDDPSLSSDRWEDTPHSLLLSRTADLVAQLCLFYGIRPLYLSEAELTKWHKWRRKGRGGIVVEGHMAQGYWPDDYFLTLVKANIEKHKLLKK